MKTERLAASCEHKRRYLFVPFANQASQVSTLKTVKSNSFLLCFFALFEIFSVYMSASLIRKQTVTAKCDVVIELYLGMEACHHHMFFPGAVYI